MLWITQSNLIEMNDHINLGNKSKNKINEIIFLYFTINLLRPAPQTKAMLSSYYVQQAPSFHFAVNFFSMLQGIMGTAIQGTWRSSPYVKADLDVWPDLAIPACQNAASAQSVFWFAYLKTGPKIKQPSSKEKWSELTRSRWKDSSSTAMMTMINGSNNWNNLLKHFVWC